MVVGMLVVSSVRPRALTTVEPMEAALFFETAPPLVLLVFFLVQHHHLAGAGGGRDPIQIVSSLESVEVEAGMGCLQVLID